MKIRLLGIIVVASSMYIFSAFTLGKGGKEKIVEQIEQQISNQIGIDAQNLAELLQEKKISPEALQKTIRSKFPVCKKEKVVVRSGKELCNKERLYLKNRRPKVAKTLQVDFGIDKELKIGFSCSGGGNRAMIGTLGLLTAAAQHKFLDASLYLAGLSGSTWIIAGWSYMYLKGLLSADLVTSLEEYEDMLVGALNYACPIKAPACLPDDLSKDIKMPFAYNLAKHFAYDQCITIVDLYGAFVANYALKKIGADRLGVVWSSMAQKAELGTIPLPICSAVVDVNERGDEEYDYSNPDFRWFETGPFEAGCTALGFIPIWAFGSTFKNGKLVFQVPENEMSLYFGVYGCAFGLAVDDFVDPAILQPTFKVNGQEILLPTNLWMKNLVDITNRAIHEKKSRKIHAQFQNYSQGLASSALKDIKQFAMFDGGESFHNPLPLLFDRPERAVDVAIVYDSYPGRVQSLLDAAAYFKKEGSTVPDIEKVLLSFGKTEKEQNRGLLSKPMTVFNDPRLASYNPEQPTLLYFPTPESDISQPPYSIDVTKHPEIIMPINNSKRPYITPNFKYSPSDIKNLSKTMQLIFESQVDEMKKVLKLVSEKKRI